MKEPMRDSTFELLHVLACISKILLWALAAGSLKYATLLCVDPAGTELGGFY